MGHCQLLKAKNSVFLCLPALPVLLNQAALSQDCRTAVASQTVSLFLDLLATLQRGSIEW